MNIITKKTYELLAYAQECLERGVDPDYIEAQKLLNANNKLMEVVVEEAIDDGLIRGLFITGDYIFGDSWHITRKGAEYLEENKAMRKAAKQIGEVFKPLLMVAVEHTVRASIV